MLLGSAGVAQVSQLADISLPKLGRGGARLARDRDIDVVHVHGGFNPSNTAVSSRLSRPYVFSPHSAYDPVSLRRSRTRKVFYKMAFERRMLRRASLVVALTEAEEADVRAFGVDARTAVIPNGVAPPPGEVDRGIFRRRLGISVSTPLTVFVGRLDTWRKGLDVLVRGLAAAPQWHAALIGPPFRDVGRLTRLIQQYALGERVHLVGELHGSRLLEAVGSADVFALLSRWEGLPMTLLEALSLEVPALVSPEVDRTIEVEASGAGWVAEQDGVGEVLRRIANTSPEVLGEKRRAAATLAARYAWRSVAERYDAAYELAVATRGAARS
jgi:glycosyltransferase involved in cell wall biosynthesis